MSTREQRLKRKAYYEYRMRDVLLAKRAQCPNCGKRTGGCYVPASFGEPGFYTCEPAAADAGRGK